MAAVTSFSVAHENGQYQCNNYFPSYRVNNFFFESLTLTFGKKLLPEELNVCINYEFNLLDHVSVVAKAGGVRRVDKINMATVASFSIAHENVQHQ